MAGKASLKAGTAEVQRKKPWWEMPGFRQETRCELPGRHDGACLLGLTLHV